MNSAYKAIHPSGVPRGARWTTPLSNQGQMIEVQYSTGAPGQSDDSGEGDLFMREVSGGVLLATYRRTENS